MSWYPYPVNPALMAHMMASSNKATSSSKVVPININIAPAITTPWFPEHPPVYPQFTMAPNSETANKAVVKKRAPATKKAPTVRRRVPKKEQLASPTEPVSWFPGYPGHPVYPQFMMTSNDETATEAVVTERASTTETMSGFPQFHAYPGYPQFMMASNNETTTETATPKRAPVTKKATAVRRSSNTKFVPKKVQQPSAMLAEPMPWIIKYSGYPVSEVQFTESKITKKVPVTEKAPAVRQPSSSTIGSATTVKIMPWFPGYPKNPEVMMASNSKTTIEASVTKHAPVMKKAPAVHRPTSSKVAPKRVNEASKKPRQNKIQDILSKLQAVQKTLAAIAKKPQNRTTAGDSKVAARRNSVDKNNTLPTTNEEAGFSHQENCCRDEEINRDEMSDNSCA